MMKTIPTILALLAASALILRAEDETPVPPEIQALAEAFAAAFKSGDATALGACWHAPEALAKVKEAEAASQAATSATAIDPAKENEREHRRQVRNLEQTQLRATQLREFIAKHFGDAAQITFTSVEVDLDDDAPADAPAYDEIDIRLKAADGTALKLEIDEAVKIGDAWKFKGRLDDELTIELPVEA